MLYKLNTTHKRDSTQRNDHQLLVKILLKKKKKKKESTFPRVRYVTKQHSTHHSTKHSFQ